VDGFVDLREATSVEEAAAVVVEVEVRPCVRVAGTFLIDVPVVGVGDRRGRSAAGVGGGEIKATFLPPSTTIAATVVVVLVLVTLRLLLAVVGSG
jgi:hypothetical protein